MDSVSSVRGPSARKGASFLPRNERGLAAGLGPLVGGGPLPWWGKRKGRRFRGRRCRRWRRVDEIEEGGENGWRVRGEGVLKGGRWLWMGDGGISLEAWGKLREGLGGEWEPVMASRIKGEFSRSQF